MFLCLVHICSKLARTATDGRKSASVNQVQSAFRAILVWPDADWVLDPMSNASNLMMMFGCSTAMRSCQRFIFVQNFQEDDFNSLALNCYWQNFQVLA